MSYNFEVNFGLPSSVTGFKPVKFENFLNRRTKRNLLNRKNFYQIIMENLKLHGYPGKSCILKIICEISNSSLNENNGIFGDLMEIIFSPSKSIYEKELSKDFYEIEMIGRNSSINCNEKFKKCNLNFLDLISL